MTTSQTMALSGPLTVSGSNQVGLGGCWDWLDTAAVWFPLGGGIKAFRKSVPTHQIPTGDPVTPPLASFSMSLYIGMGLLNLDM